MAITVNSNNTETYRPVTGLTDDVVFKLNSGKAYKLQGIVTSAGSAQAIETMESDTPTDIARFSKNASGASTANFTVDVTAGNAWAGVEITSGTWDVIIREIEEDAV